MKHPLIILALLTLGCIAVAQSRPRFDGGMMMHAGYVDGTIAALNYRAEGATFGMGGVLRIHLDTHLRIGGEGYVSTLRQMGHGYVRTSWGGAMTDVYWQLGRWMPYAGLCFGGGKTSTLLVFDGIDNDWCAEPNTVLHNESFLFLNPYIGVEYALTDAIHLTVRADRLMPMAGVFAPIGIRCYVGFVFTH